MDYALLWAVFGVLCLAVPAIAYASWLLSAPWVQVGLTDEGDPIISKFDHHRHRIAEVFVEQQTRDVDSEFEREFRGV